MQKLVETQKLWFLLTIRIKKASSDVKVFRVKETMLKWESLVEGCITVLRSFCFQILSYRLSEI